MPVPLQWVIGTLTVWHYAIWVLYAGLGLRRPRDQENDMPYPIRIWGAVFMPPIFYCMVALIAGQIFGDKFAWSQLWPAGLSMGAIFASPFLIALVPALWNGKGRRIEFSIMTVVFVPLATAFFGLFFTFACWIFPRVIEWGGLIDFPDLAWGVHLYRAP
jgi:hypothetical protein